MYFAFVLLILFVPYVYLQNNYGPYKVEMSYYSTCNGIKQNNITQVRVDNHKKSKHKYVTLTNVTVLSNTQFDALNLAVYRDDNEENVLWRYEVQKPCQHPIFKQFQTMYIDKQCNVQKGTYYPQFLLCEQAKVFFGDQFFYGSFTFKMTVTNKKDILICLLAKCRFVKKT